MSAEAGAATSAFRRLAGYARDPSESGVARRLTGAAFLARVLNAGLGFATQILLARWMGEREYGIYAYLWVWLLVAGGIGSVGLPVAALKFVPEYRTRGDLPALRGFLRFSRTFGLVPSVGLALGGAGLAMAFVSGHGAIYLPAALLALVILPLYVLTDIQTGIARAFDYMDLGLAADYLFRPVLLLAATAALALAGQPGTAVIVMLATLAGMAVTALVQGLALQSRLRAAIGPGPARTDVGRWAAVSWPLLTVSGFTLLLGSTDVIILKLFVGPEDIAVYFAATKIVAVASFVAYGVANTSAHRFAAHAASGDRDATTRLAAETVSWTFWPTLAVAAGLAVFAGPLLMLFGPNFAGGAPIVALLGLGLVAGAAVGPADRALAMADQGRATARIYALAFLLNALLALVLVPIFGLAGAALATALAMAGKSLLLFFAARKRLGLVMLVGASPNSSTLPGAIPPADVNRVEAELLAPAEADAIVEAWRDLSPRALEPNVFFTADCATAGMRHLPEARGSRLLVAWRGRGPERRLVGAWPLLRPRGRWFNPLPVLRAAQNYGTVSTPLIDRDRPDEVLAAMLHALDRAGLRGLLLPFMPVDGPVAASLERVAIHHGLASSVFEGHARAFLRSSLPGAEYVRATLETRRRKEADRQRRRLADEGALAFSVATDPEEVARALDAFLDLESGGWKGQAGTDLRQAPGGAAFMIDAARQMAAHGAFRVATLTLDGRAVAAGLIGIDGPRAYYIKTTYDENFARFSPGLLLTLDLTRYLLDDPLIEDADSIAVMDHPMIDRVWTERMTIASVMLSTRAGGGTLFRAAVTVESLRERARREWRRIRARRSGVSDACRSLPANDAAKNG